MTMAKQVIPTAEKQRVRVMLPLSSVPPGASPPHTSLPDQLKVIFLDIDGVLNSLKTYVIHKRYPGTLSPEERTEKKAYVDFREAFDQCSVGLLNQLCLVTGAVIVLSSSWRIDFDTWEVKELLAEIGINPNYVIGRTDDVGTSMDRTDQIDRYLKALDTKEGRKALLEDGLLDTSFENVALVKVVSYVIMEDEETMSEAQAPNTIIVDPVDGLTLRDVLKAGTILNNDGMFYVNALQGKPSVGSENNALH